MEHIRVFIDRIVVFDAGSLSWTQRRHLQRDIQNELANLINTNGIPNSLRPGGAIAKVSVSLDGNSPHSSYTDLGRSIAYSLYAQLNQAF